ncbi:MULTISPECIES: GNAT family N-acetyltransferase [Streptomyces]|uniref:Protein involved in cellulose biosynthesis (CelD) n=1 Tax=Streptomyces chartreusis NRRL 3882 TaxID=1079985 RepID=A0A2N9B2I3_STRCX|nr:MULTISPECIES: GNAT family N-acetyltransferase [Streptomyces]MYS93091.1 GNAT family N-acetyltransferase [Streptomyces sp. SID5464]SOR77551.1 Protein involved in cellulose biosynthesis (CelD) [Streptomyces chartreusis NRRL 3882]
MDIDVCRAQELTAADRTAWTTLQSKAPLHGMPQMANPFLAPEFALAVGQCRSGVRIAVLRDGPGGEPAAFFPYQRTPAGVGRAIGLGLSDCQGLVHEAGFRWDAQALLAACGLAVWEFDHLAEGQQPFERFATASFPSPVIDVADGWEACVARMRERSPKGTRVRLAKERRLGRAAGEISYVHDERDPAMLRTLMAWKSAQYRRTGRSDRFAHPWITRLVEQLFHTRTDSFNGQLSVLYAGGRPVAAHFGLRTDHVLSCWFPAYDPAFAKYSPGVVLHMRMAQGAADGSVSYLDLGRGRGEYKDSLKTREMSVSEGWVTRRHPVAVAHRALRAPVRALRNSVVSRPELYGSADRLLKRVGRLRTAVRPNP